MPSTHISIRVTDQRRANLDALAALIRSDSDTATIDWALGYALAHLTGTSQEPGTGKEIDMNKERKLAERIYNEVFGGDDKYHRGEHQGRIEDWLHDGDLGDNSSLEDLVAEWREFDQPEERDSYE